MSGFPADRDLEAAARIAAALVILHGPAFLPVLERIEGGRDRRDMLARSLARSFAPYGEKGLANRAIWR